ncbi:hypothetical protein [Campylobacter sp. CCUG 57310]|uniref:hypothetical protein n=1 Tax=Campylobacter sp. CCUG 57310 TaxID=2517362 RepID=UPI001567895C|nr:hypothetical protein [Campylobacter sp. CCUG 57310]QKF92107.1 hypothetical protein CORI_0906 [Campylobacter sp. CCUG 57310]
MRALTALGLSFAIAFGSSNVDIIKELFTNPNFDKARHFRGEAARRNHDFNIKGFYITEITPLGKGYEFDVFRVSVSSNDDSEHFDLYVYMIEDGIYAVRSLARTGIIKDAIDNYDKFSQREKEAIDLENLKLVLLQDSKLLKFGRENEAKFEEIFKLSRSGLNEEMIRAEEILNTLHLSHIVDDREFDYNIIVGGMLNNLIGFMRVEHEADVPKMNPSRYIMIERLSQDSKWYLFKVK